MRAVRFASRFDFSVDQELEHAIASETIRNILKTNISRARYIVRVLIRGS